MYNGIIYGYIMIIGIVKIGAVLTALEEFRNAPDESAAVAGFCSEYTPPLNTSDYLGINADGIDLTKTWGYDFGAANPSLKEITFIMNTPAPVDLDTYKNDIIQDILEKRTERLDNNFILAEYPSGSGKMFDCSVEAQDNWDKLKTLFDLGHVSGDFMVSTYDRRDTHTIADSSDLSGLIAAVASKVLEERTLAGGYISSVIAAPDEAGAIAAAKPYLDL